MGWQHVGDAGTVEVEVDQASGKIMIKDVDDDGFVFNLVDAAYLAVLLDEAIELAKGSGVKLDAGLD